MTCLAPDALDTGLNSEASVQKALPDASSDSASSLPANFSPEQRELLEQIGRDPSDLNSASTELRGDRNFVLAAVRRDGRALQWTTSELKADKAVVLEAVKNSGESLDFASSALRADKDIVLEAVKNNGHALSKASAELRQDKDILLEAVKKNGNMLCYANEELRADKELVLEAVKCDGYALRYASKALQADRDFVFEAMKLNRRAFVYACGDCETDKDLLLLAARAPEGMNPRLLCSGAKEPIYTSLDFQSARWSAIAVRGEEAPIVTVTSLQRVGSAAVQSGATAVGETFRCEASLMSGSSFECYVSPSKNSDRQGTERSGPILYDLAAELVSEVKERYCKDATRAFISILVNDEGEALSMSPWDWKRPLAEFQKASNEVTG